MLGNLKAWWATYQAKRKYQEYLAKHHCDQRCSHCGTWQGTHGGWAMVERFTPYREFDRLTCGKCGVATVFIDVGMGFIEATPEQIAVAEEREKLFVFGGPKIMTFDETQKILKEHRAQYTIE